MKKNTKRKIIESVEESLTNNITEEVFAKTKKVVYRVAQEPAYVKLYLNTIMYICDLQERHASVLMAILRRMPFADNICQQISLSKGIKQDIAKEIGKTESYVSHAISDLSKGKILIHNDSSKRSTCYQINPHIFARGDWKDIEELQLKINFTAQGTTFMSQVKIQNAIKESTEYMHQKRDEYLRQQKKDLSEIENNV